MDVLLFSQDKRRALQVLDDQKLLIGAAWVLEHKKRYFTMFPNVLMVDTTQQTHNERRPLATFVGKRLDGLTFVSMRVLLPSEKRFAFNWLFHIAAPKLLDMEKCRR
eukprot:11791504-Ditylum_brightwellii.AAC.1